MKKFKSFLIVILLLPIVFFCSGCRNHDEHMDQINNGSTEISYENSKEAIVDGNDLIKETTGVPDGNVLSKADTEILDKNTLSEAETKKLDENTAVSEKSGVSDDDTLAEEDKSMPNKNLITKEKLLEFVKINDTGLDEDDFANIDIDGFIDYAWLSENNLATLNIKAVLELYKSTLKSREFDKYRAKEIFSVYSTDEEYESFKNTFFDKIDTDKQYIGKVEGFTDRFDMVVNGKRMMIGIGQTKNLDKFKFDTFPNGALGIRAGYGEDAPLYSEFCYSKNKKYFIWLPPSMEVIEAFCEVDD